MNPSPESEHPPVAPRLPRANPEAAWRKVLLTAAVTATIAPVAWVLVFLVLHFAVEADWLRFSENIAAIGAVFPAIMIAAGAAWLGLRRGWHRRRVVLLSWGISSAAALAIAVGVDRGVRSLRHRSQVGAVLGNLRQLSAAADQYFFENPYRVMLARHDLIGPTSYIKEQRRVNGEDYEHLFPIRAGSPEVFVIPMPWGESVQYDPADVPRPAPRDGVQVVQLPDGRRCETTYRGGVADGPFRAYRADGKLWAEAAYVQGRQTGPVWNYSGEGPRFNELDPAQIPENSARRKLAAGDFRGAVADFDRAVALNPNDPALLKGRADAALGLERLQLGNKP